MAPARVGDRIGDRAVPIVRPDGTSVATSLSALAADRPVLMSFYPGDFGPDCTEQWCAFRDFGWFTGHPGVRVVGSSRSSAAEHRRFIEALALGFPLVADGDLDLSDAFGVTEGPAGCRRSRRSCFLVDSTLAVRYRWLEDGRSEAVGALPVAAIYDDLQALLGWPRDEFAFDAATEV